MRYCRWRSRSRDRNCATAKIYADLEAAKEVQSEQAVHLGRWRKSVRENREIVDGFAEGVKPLRCNARTEFDLVSSCHLNSVGRCCWILKGP